MNVFLIGGPKAGEYMQIEDGVNLFTVPHHPPIRFRSVHDLSPMEQSITNVGYRVFQFSDEQDTRQYGLVEGLTPKDAQNLLEEAYTRICEGEREFGPRRPPRYQPDDEDLF